MSVNWTLQNTSVTGETQWTNASYNNIPLVIPNLNSGQIDFLEVAGYTSGTISFTISPDPDGGVGWPGGGASTLEISIIGGIDGTFAAPISSFVVQTLEIKGSDSGTTFYVEWNIPIQFVSLLINNDTSTPTGTAITVTNIRLQTESEGGGVGFTSSSGATIGPGGSTPEMQFNDGGIFGGASGVLYDKTVNPGPPIIGQVQLAAGAVGTPMLAFSDATHPAGTYDTGIYRAGVNALGFSGNSLEQATIYPLGGAIPIGFNAGLNIGTTTNVTGIQRLSLTAQNSWEDGNCGNSEFIVFTASDFAGAFSNPVLPAGRAQTYVTLGPNSPVVYNGLQPGAALACKLIPKGFIIDNGDRALCFIYSDIAVALGVPQQMIIDVRVQIAAGPTIDVPLQIASVTIPAAAAGWLPSGIGSVNRTVINIAAFGGAATAAATGTGFNIINVLVTPNAAMSATTGGIVAFKVPIKRI